MRSSGSVAVVGGQLGEGVGRNIHRRILGMRGWSIVPESHRWPRLSRFTISSILRAGPSFMLRSERIVSMSRSSSAEPSISYKGEGPTL